MKLSELVPLAAIQAALEQPVEPQSLDTSSIEEVRAYDREDLFGAAASAWHRAVHRKGSRLNPREMGSLFDKGDSHLAEAVQARLGVPLFKDFGASVAVATYEGAQFTVAQSSVAHLCFDELHLGDILMADPRRPIPELPLPAAPSHRGFGLLGKFMDNLKAAARQNGCAFITLNAANLALVRVFQRHGFVVEDNQIARVALRVGVGIPMEYACDRE